MASPSPAAPDGDLSLQHGGGGGQSVNAATEPTYRRELFNGLLAEVRQSMAVRESYLKALEG